MLQLVEPNISCFLPAVVFHSHPCLAYVNQPNMLTASKVYYCQHSCEQNSEMTEENIGIFAVQGNNRKEAYREVCCTGNIRV